MVMGSRGKSMARSLAGTVDEERMSLGKLLFEDGNLCNFIAN